MIRVVYLGRLADVAGAESQEFAHSDKVIGWDALLAMFDVRLAEAASAPTVRLAVNGALLSEKSTLSVRSGDEVALLPPVSGG